MPKRLSKEAKRPTDPVELMFQLGKQSTQEKQPDKTKAPSRSEISRIMAAMGRRGGKKSAKARMEKISPEERTSIALRAARARWANKEESSPNRK